MSNSDSREHRARTEPVALGPPKSSTDDIVGRCERMVEELTKLTGRHWSFGYIGKCGVDGHGKFDDRAWHAFREHPGRVGTHRDSIGGEHTGDLEKLATRLSGAVSLAVVQNEPREQSYIECEHCGERRYRPAVKWCDGCNRHG